MVIKDRSSRLHKGLNWLGQDIPGYSIGLFRFGFGVLMAWAMIRLQLNGWVADFWQRPSFYFPYISWVQPLDWVHIQVWILAAVALLLAIGWHCRVMALLLALGFTWLELSCKSTYLNHYYLVSILACWLALIPAGSTWSLDALRHQRNQRPLQSVQRWHLVCLQLQISFVWICAGIAKIQSDWLLHGIPLWFWFRRFDDLVFVGPLLRSHMFAIMASWAGMLYDLSIPWLLTWKRTRFIAFLVLIVFHLITALAFPIGIFPWLMMLSATLYLKPNWPRKFSRQQTHPKPPESQNQQRFSQWAALAAVVFLSIQLVSPFRHYFNERPHQLLWHERGFRWGWRVMVMEKTGWLRYTIILEDGTQYVINPASKLAPHQAKQITTQPDMILYFAHHIPELYEIDHIKSIYAQSWVSLNGRNPSQLIKPDVDLLKITIKNPINQWVTELPQD